MVKFPGGTTARWEKIADEISRPVDEVIKKAKQIKSGGYVVSVQAAAQGKVTWLLNNKWIKRISGIIRFIQG